MWQLFWVVFLFFIFYLLFFIMESRESGKFREFSELGDFESCHVATVSPILGFVGGRPQPRDRPATVDPKTPAQRRDRLGDPDQRSTPSTLLGHGSRPCGGGLWPGRLFY